MAALDDELQFHLEERGRGNVARGMEPEGARKAALERLGDLERVRSECTGSLAAERRAQERRGRPNVSWLDVKLGVRILAKHPLLSLVAVLGMAIAIAIGAGYFAAFGALLETALPLEEGDRVVSIRNRDVTRPGNYRTSVHDFVRGREELTSVQELGAYREDSRNLITADGRTALVRVAEMTASGFQLTRISPVLGRTLLDEDEHAGAPPVIVVGYEEWQRRFDGDPDILGSNVRLDENGAHGGRRDAGGLRLPDQPSVLGWRFDLGPCEGRAPNSGPCYSIRLFSFVTAARFPRRSRSATC